MKRTSYPPSGKGVASILALAAVWLGSPTGAAAPGPQHTAEDAIVLVRTTNSLRATRGSGFIIGDGGWVVTASHVVSVDLGKGRRESDRTALVYSPWTGQPLEARVAVVDGAADIALLRLPVTGMPALALEGMEAREPEAAHAALKDRPLTLFGFPLTYGESTVAALARPEHADTRLRQIRVREHVNLCVLDACPNAQPGWSGGPVLSRDRNAVVAVFHSLYRKAGTAEGYPAASVSAHLGTLLKQAGVNDLARFEHPGEPTQARAARGAELMALAMRGLAWSAAGQWKKAEEEQREILKLAPGDALARVELGRALLAQKRVEEALTELREAARLAPKSVVANLVLGRAAHLNQDTATAIAALQAAAAASPGEVEPQLLLGEVYADNQKPEQAEEVLRKALVGAPSHPVLLFRLGTLLLGKMPDQAPDQKPVEKGHDKRAEEGRKLLEAAAEAAEDPALSYISLAYGRAQENDRKFKDAETIYRRVIRTDPENPMGYFYLAALFYRINRLDDAQIQVNNGISLPRLSEEMVQAFRGLQAKINARGAEN